MSFNFNFDNGLQEYRNCLDKLKLNLTEDLEKMGKNVALSPRSIPPSNDMLDWAGKLFKSCFVRNNYEEFYSECPKILKYVTLLPDLEYFLNYPKARNELVESLKRYPRERFLNNLVLFYFRKFREVEQLDCSGFQEIFTTYFMTNSPKLVLIKFFHSHDLKLTDHRMILVEKVIDSYSSEELLNNCLPEEIKSTDYFKEILISIAFSLRFEDSHVKALFWEKVKSLKNHDVTKICVANYAMNARSEADKEVAKEKAMTEIADPSKIQLWHISDKYNEYRDIVEEARNKIELWINKQFVSVFFHTMAASNRGEFWLGYVNHLTSVQILGSKYFLQRMKSSFPSASKYLDNVDRFKICGNSSEACVFMHFKKHIIILFDTKNKAGICRLKSDPSLPKFKYYGNVTSIIDGGFHKAYNVEGDRLLNMKDDGRLFHTYDWEADFRTYLQNMVL